MPIETDSSNIDFAWKFNQTGVGQDEVIFSLRLHRTPEYGWTISFLNEDNQPQFSLPADMFLEVSQHISKYIYQVPEPKTAKFPGAKTIGMPTIGRSAVPAARPASRTVPMPIQRPAISRPVQERPDSRTIHVTEDGKTIEAVQVDAEAEFGPTEGVFLPSGHDIRELEIDDNAPVFQAFTIPDQPKPKPVPTIAESDMDQIIAERKAAANNPNRKTGLKPAGIKKYTKDETE